MLRINVSLTWLMSFLIQWPQLNGLNRPTHWSEEGDSGWSHLVVALSLHGHSFPSFNFLHLYDDPSRWRKMLSCVLQSAMSCVGFTKAATQALVEEQQEIDNLEEFRLLSYESFCKKICWPCGNLVLPLAAGALPGAAPVLPNPGVSVKQCA